MIDEILNFVESRVEAQGSLAMAHMSDAYWTDLNTGHNVGKDELRAYGLMLQMVTELKKLEWTEPADCAHAVSSDLETVRNVHRNEYVDPDGYGASTIRTVIEEFDRFCDERGLRHLGSGPIDWRAAI